MDDKRINKNGKQDLMFIRLFMTINVFSAGFVWSRLKNLMIVLYSIDGWSPCYSLNVIRDNNKWYSMINASHLLLIVLLPIVNFELRSYFHQHFIANDIIQFIDTELLLFFIHIFVLYMFLMCLWASSIAIGQKRKPIKIVKDNEASWVIFFSKYLFL